MGEDKTLSAEELAERLLVLSEGAQNFADFTLGGVAKDVATREAVILRQAAKLISAQSAAIKAGEEENRRLQMLVLELQQ